MSGKQNLEAVLGEIEEKSKAFGYISGTSMLPMLKESRDIVVLIPAKDALRVGDVVLFVRERKDDELVLHRIVKSVPGDGYLIRGDNTFWNEPVKREDVKAVAEGFFRKGKYCDCNKSRGYRLYVFYVLHFNFIRKFFRRTLRIAGAKVKNSVFHLDNLHLDDILKKK